MTMTTTAPANSIELRAQNIRGVEFQKLSNGNPDEKKMQAIQAAMLAAAVSIDQSAGYLKQHFYPGTCADLQALAAILTKSAEALQPAIEQAEQMRKTKAANPGEVWDRMPSNLTFSTKPTPAPLVEQLNAANAAFWAKQQEAKQ